MSEMSPRYKIGIAAAILIMFGAGCLSSGSTDSRPKVAATFFPLADIAKQIAGADIEVVTLLPPGASPHGFEPTPQQARDAANSQVLFAIGHGLDDWARKLSSSNYVRVDNGIKLKPPLAIPYIGQAEPEEVDPHYWLTAQNGKVIAANIAAEFKKIDPQHSADFEQRLKDFELRLDATDAQIKTLFAGKQNRNIVTHHSAWQYFAAAYGLNIVGVIEPSPNQELTPNELAELQKIIRANKVTSVFIEPELSEQTVKPLAQDLRLTIRSVDPEGGSNGIQNYQDLLLKNAQTFATTLK